MRTIMLKPESEKSHEEALEEKKILEELIEVSINIPIVDKRSLQARKNWL